MEIKNYDKILLNEIGTNLKKFRKYKKFSQSYLAKGICDRTVVSEIENGLQKNPSINILIALFEKLEINFDYILNLSNNQIKKFNDKEEYIYNLINLGKYSEAEEFSNKNININSSKLEYKLYYYIKGTKSFYDKNLSLSLELFEMGLKNVIYDKGLSIIDILLTNGKLTATFNINATKIFKNPEIEKILDIQLESIKFLLGYNIKTMTRMLINIADFYRCVGNFKISEKILIESEEIIKNNDLWFLKIDLNFIKVALFCSINKKEMIPSILDETYQLINIFDLKEIKEISLVKINFIKKTVLQYS